MGSVQLKDASLCYNVLFLSVFSAADAKGLCNLSVLRMRPLLVLGGSCEGGSSLGEQVGGFLVPSACVAPGGYGAVGIRSGWEW